MLVFQRVKKAGLKFKASKAMVAVPQVKFLGHVLTRDDMAPNPEYPRTLNMAFVRNYRIPKTMKQLKSFLRVVGFYMRFAEKFGEIARPLYDLTKTGVMFIWNYDPLGLYSCPTMLRCTSQQSKG